MVRTLSLASSSPASEIALSASYLDAADPGRG
jgi:hypothetical protein